MLGGWSGGKYLTIGKRVSDVEYELVANTSVVTSNNIWYNVKINLEESNISAKIWAVGSSEPSDWQISYSGAVKFGEYIVIGTEGGQDNEEFWFDNISVTSIPSIENIFDTGLGTYPSISGTHNGTITPNQTIEVQKLYTYPCTGTGGHTNYAKIWNSIGWNVTATWDGYVGDWHNITFGKPFTLVEGETYNYTIKTGSYPQIHHADALLTSNGWINCTEFTDANGKRHNNWIPAVRLWAE